MSTVLVNSNAQITINDQTLETIPVDLTNFGLAASQKSKWFPQASQSHRGRNLRCCQVGCPTSKRFNRFGRQATSQASLLSLNGAPTTAI